jgi:hypothetical protein
MVLRVDPALRGKLKGIADRIFAETAHDYSYSAIVRGLIALGLAAIEGREVLAPLFEGMRIARGRKKRVDPFDAP